MTPAERRDPKIINGSRRQPHRPRLRHHGRREVNSLVDRFFEARKMMKQMAGGGGHARHARDAGMPGTAGQRAKGSGAAPKEGTSAAPATRPSGRGPRRARPGRAAAP